MYFSLSIATLIASLFVFACQFSTSVSTGSTVGAKTDILTDSKIDTTISSTPDAPPPNTTNDVLVNPYYAWLAHYDATQSVTARIAVPTGYSRMPIDGGSFAEWLAFLPLKVGKPDVLLYNGQRKGNQTAHAAVVNIDVGNKDLQQCADAVMRLRAEYLWSAQRYNDIHFRYTSGHDALYSKWRQGYRPSVVGSSVVWTKKAAPDATYQSFKQYLQQVFNYCGTSSLSKELKPVTSVADIQAGDVFIRGGFPGHAVIVVDVAKNPDTGKKIFLLAQSYMPAQEIHLLRNPNNDHLSPWYDTDFGDILTTPEWAFERGQLKRF